MKFGYQCDTDYGFVPDPDQPECVGYVTALAALGQDLSADLTVTNPLTGANILVAGVMGTFQWAGAVEDPLVINMYVSQKNAAQLKVLLQSALTTATVSALDYIIVNYDQATKQWFVQAAPQGQSLSGTVAGGQNPELQVDLTPVAVKGTDLNIYPVSVQIVPPANQGYALTFASSSTEKVAESWGLVLASPA
jgi:hypothetical protein